MTRNDPPCDADALLREGAEARRLAGSLVTNRDLADDVAQDAVVAAWRSGPEGDARGPWLAAVVRRLAARVHRGASRRLRRERAAARPEQLPSTVDLVERAQAQRAAVAVVLGLDEPYRTTLLLRFLHGASYADIATQEGVTVEAVRSRIKRGLALARARLDHAHGSRRAWVVPLAGMARVELGSMMTVGVGAIGMGKLAFGAAAAALVLLAFWVSPGLWPAGVPPTQPPVPDAVASGGGSPQQDVSAPPSPEVERLAVAPPAATRASLSGRLVSEVTGLGVRGQVELWAAGEAARVVASETGEDGRFALGLADATPGDWRELRARAPDHALVRIDLRGQASATKSKALGDIVLPAGTLITGRVVDTDGMGVAAAELLLAEGEPFDAARLVGRTRVGGYFTLDEPIAPVVHAWWGGPARPFLIALGEKGIGFATLDPSRQRLSHADVLVRLDPTADVTVQVLDERGVGIAGAHVAVHATFVPLKPASEWVRYADATRQARFTARTDATGTAWLRTLPIAARRAIGSEHGVSAGGDTYRVRASAAGYGDARSDEVRLRPGGSVVKLTLPGRHTVEVSGFVRDPLGHPIEAAVVAPAGSTIGARCDAAGRYLLGPIEHPGDRPLVLWARAPGYARAAATPLLDLRQPAMACDFTLRPATVVRGIVRDDAHRPVEGASVWVTDQAGQGVLDAAVTTDAAGAFTLPSVPRELLQFSVSAIGRADGFWVGVEGQTIDVATGQPAEFVLAWVSRASSRVTLAIVDAVDGSPADALDVRYRAIGRQGSLLLPELMLRSGGAVLRGLPAGRWRLTVEAQGHRRGTCEVDLPTDTSEVDARCVVARPGAIVGTLVLADLPAELREVGAIWTTPFSAARWQPLPGQTNVEVTRGFVPVAALGGGPFRLEDIEPDTEVTMFVSEGLVHGMRKVKVPAGAEVQVELRLEVGGALRFVRTTDAPHEGARIELRRASATEVTRTLYDQSDDDEIVRVALAEGEWTWTARWSGDPTREVSGRAHVTKGQTRDVLVGR